ncbi:MAG: kelch repeat-containing protein [Gemmatimonadaceae bacterium]
MKTLAHLGGWLVLVTTVAACKEPMGTAKRPAGDLLANSEVFATRPWITQPPDLLAREYSAAVTVGEDLYVVGGWTGSALSGDLTMFDPLTSSWTPLAPRPNPAYAALGAQTLAGQIYVVGGVSATGVPNATVSVYDPPSNTWTTTTPLPVPGGCGGSGVIAGTLYALTGCETFVLNATGSLFSYNRVTQQWTPLASNPIPRTYPAVVAAGGKLYAVGGVLANGRTSDDLTVFTPGTGNWQAKTPIPVGRYGAAAVPYGSKIAVFGGFSFSGAALTDVWLYDPSTNAWVKPATSGFVARGYLAAAVAAGAAYAVGGHAYATGAPTNAVQQIFP